MPVSLRNYQYVSNVGDLKCVLNLEYRPRLFGSLYGALFVDSSNVWTFSEARKSLEYDILGDGVGKRFEASKFLTDFAVGAGVGIRDDLDFFVLRIDWGFVVHDPRYDSKSGYFNFSRFSKSQCLNFAIGYPF